MADYREEACVAHCKLLCVGCSYLQAVVDWYWKAINTQMESTLELSKIDRMAIGEIDGL